MTESRRRAAAAMWWNVSFVCKLAMLSQQPYNGRSVCNMCAEPCLRIVIEWEVHESVKKKYTHWGRRNSAVSDSFLLQQISYILRIFVCKYFMQNIDGTYFPLFEYANIGFLIYVHIMHMYTFSSFFFFSLCYLYFIHIFSLFMVIFSAYITSILKCCIISLNLVCNDFGTWKNNIP